MLCRKYTLNTKNLERLKAKVNANNVKKLALLTDKNYSSRRNFIEAVQQVCPSLSKSQLRLVVRNARGGIMGLEKILPNRDVREWVEALFFAIIIALVLRTYAFSPFKIPTGSMIPTIEVGDHIFATMYDYGLEIPFTDKKIFASDIQRGDIVIFPYPKDPSLDYIKRVIGLPGDKLEISNLKVYINDVLLEEDYAYYDEKILNLASMTNQLSSYDFGPITVPEGKVFVMGDNRFNSLDSRVWGFVDISSIKGKARIIFWSHDPNQSIFSGYNLGRIGSYIE